MRKNTKDRDTDSLNPTARGTDTKRHTDRETDILNPTAKDLDHTIKNTTDSNAPNQTRKSDEDRYSHSHMKNAQRAETPKVHGHADQAALTNRQQHLAAEKFLERKGRTQLRMLCRSLCQPGPRKCIVGVGWPLPELYSMSLVPCFENLLWFRYGLGAVAR